MAKFAVEQRIEILEKQLTDATARAERAEAQIKRLEKKVHDQRSDLKNRMLLECQQDLNFRKYLGWKLAEYVGVDTKEYGSSRIHTGIDALKQQRDELRSQLTAMAEKVELELHCAKLDRETLGESVQFYRNKCADYESQLTAAREEATQARTCAVMHQEWHIAEQKRVASLLASHGKLREAVAEMNGENPIGPLYGAGICAARDHMLWLIDSIQGKDLPTAPKQE